MKRLILALAIAGALTVPAALAEPAKPKSVVHIINVRFKSDAAKADIDKAIQAVGSMKYDGLKNVWLRPIKNQLGPEYTHIIVMEFESEDALKKYADSPAQKEWYKLYMKVRDESRTNDVTN